jgi:hypothetical protein
MLQIALHGDLEWAFDECSKCFKEYDKGRFGNSATRIPPDLEAAFLIEIANKALIEGKSDSHRFYLKRAILNCPGSREVQIALQEAVENSVVVDYRKMFFC